MRRSLGARVPVTEATRPLGHLLLLHRDDVDGDAVELFTVCQPSCPPSVPSLCECTYAHRLEHVLGLLVHIQHATLAVLREVERRHLGHVLILPLTLLFLQLEGDAANGAALDTLHQVGGVAGDLAVGSISMHALPTH